MFSTHTLLLCTIFTIKIFAQDFSLPTSEYHHEVIYSSDGLLQAEANPEILPLATANRIAGDVALHSAGNIFRRPVLHSVNLFTPNTIQQPAETPGQAENYRKALEEEAREAERAENAITTVFGGALGGRFNDRFRENRPKSYVSVQVEGARKYDYTYQV